MTSGLPASAPFDADGKYESLPLPMYASVWAMRAGRGSIERVNTSSGAAGGVGVDVSAAIGVVDTAVDEAVEAARVIDAVRTESGDPAVVPASGMTKSSQCPPCFGGHVR